MEKQRESISNLDGTVNLADRELTVTVALLALLEAEVRRDRWAALAAMDPQDLTE